MMNPITPVRRPVAERLLPIVSARPTRALMRRLNAVTAWARLSNRPLRLGAADVTAPLDPQSRALLWYVLSETVSAIAVIGGNDLPPAAALASIGTLADRVRERLATAAPRPGSLTDGAEPPHIFVMEILTRDLLPFLGRWQSRVDACHKSGRQAGDWPLLALFRADLARTRDRLVERSWQLGMALGLSGLERILPERPVVAPVLIATDALDPALMQAGWQVYIEAATRLPRPELLAGPGALGEAISALDTLADQVRDMLRAMPPPANVGAETIQAQAFKLLSEVLQPFLTEWRPRHRRFVAAERAEAKWRRAEECRAALIATRDRCLPIIKTIGREIGAPALPEPAIVPTSTEVIMPLQLPPPEMADTEIAGSQIVS
jgi:hypothetical protein